MADKIRERGEEIPRYHSDFFFADSDFFHIHSDLSGLESGRSVIM